MAKMAKKPAQKKVYQVGNFFIKRENEHYKMYDVQQVWTMRVHFLSSMYTFIDVCLEGGNMELLEIIVKMYYCLGTTPPDGEMIKDTYTAYTAMMERIKEQMKVTEAEDAENLERARTIYEAKQELNAVLEDEGPETDTQG